MCDLSFTVTGIKPAARALAPELHFTLRITNHSPDQTVHGLLLNAQIQIRSPLRSYSADEKRKLVEIFGPPERWKETLHNKLWANTNTTLGPFNSSAETVLPVPCTFDLNVLATKFFSALESGEVPLLFLFSGSAFYATPDGRLQVQRISWDKECSFWMPVRAWQDLMDFHFPNMSWLALRRDVSERLWAFKRDNGFVTWEETIERLLSPQTERKTAKIEEATA